MISLELYKVFYETASTGSLSKAAERLYITQPSVSYAVKQLEEQLRTVLFIRKPKGVELTPEGRALMEFVAPALALLGEGERLLAHFHGLEAGEIRIGGSEVLIKQYLLAAIEAFHSKHPKILFRFVHGKTQDIVRRLEDGQIDLGLVHLPLRTADLQIHKQWEAVPIFIGDRSRKDRYKQPADPVMLFKEPLILLSPGSSTRNFVEEEARAVGIEIEPEMEVGSVDLIKELVRMGFGISVIHKDLVEAELAAGALMEIPLQRPLTKRRIGLISMSKRTLSAAADAFLQIEI